MHVSKMDLMGRVFNILWLKSRSTSWAMALRYATQLLIPLLFILNSSNPVFSSAPVNNNLCYQSRPGL